MPLGGYVAGETRPEMEIALTRILRLACLLLVCSVLGCGAAPQRPDPASGRAPASPAPAVGAPAGVVEEQVSFTAPDGTPLGAFMARPAGNGPHPALILFHEWWGLNERTREDARRFAGQGYVALAVDLYRGQQGADQDAAHELSRALPEERALGDAEAGLQYLLTRREVKPGSVGVVGWCMGGGYSLRFAALHPLQACVVCYGRVFTQPDQVAGMETPVLGLFGGQDRGIPAEDVRKFERLLADAGVPAKVVLYPDAGHAFMNPDNAKGYDAKAAASAWGEIDEFLRLHLADGNLHNPDPGASAPAAPTPR